VFGRKLHFRWCVKKNNRSFTRVNITTIFLTRLETEFSIQTTIFWTDIEACFNAGNLGVKLVTVAFYFKVVKSF